MTTICAHCEHPATLTIISTPGAVCRDHAIEFWTGLLAYTRGRSGPCVKEETMCSCPLCQELTASQARALAIVSVRSSPRDHEDFPIRLAS